MKRNTVYVTFQPPHVIISKAQAVDHEDKTAEAFRQTAQPYQLVLSDDEARELWGKLCEAYGTPPPPPDTTLAPADCVRGVCVGDGSGHSKVYDAQTGAVLFDSRLSRGTSLCTDGSSHRWVSNTASDGPKNYCLTCGAWAAGE